MAKEIVVKKSVYEMSRHVEAIGHDPSFHVAEFLGEWYRDKGLREKADFWREVRDYLMTIESVGKGASITIIPDE